MSVFSMFGFFRLALGILITGLCCRVVLAVTGLNNSVIVGSNSDYLSNLTNWIKPIKRDSDWKLCWRASRDNNNWDNSQFHSLCDDKGPTITIVKVGKYIFGGYTSLSWSTSAGSGCFGYQYDPQAFLFSLVNEPGWAPVKFDQTGEYSYKKLHSTYSCNNHGPIFGGEHRHDLKLGRVPHSSYSDLGYTYGPPSGYIYASPFARTFLAGHDTFNPDEIETFYDVAFTSQDPCIVTIYTNPFIERVVVPHPVACFTGADNLEAEKLGDFGGEINSETDAYDVVEKCAELAHGKHFKMFALGKNSVCLSGADTQNRYYEWGTNGAECKDGIGQGPDSMFVYSLDHLPDLQPLGCYNDNKQDLALPNNYANFRNQIKWEDWPQLKTVQKCAQVAVTKGYEYFAVQFYGECYTGKNASQTYKKHGRSDKCMETDKTLGFQVGMGGTNFVYRIN